MSEKGEGITGVVLGMALMMGRDANEWSEILNYAREHGWTPEPKLKEGQEVWVRGVIESDPEASSHIVRFQCSGTGVLVDSTIVAIRPDDIRTEDLSGKGQLE